MYTHTRPIHNTLYVCVCVYISYTKKEYIYLEYIIYIFGIAESYVIQRLQEMRILEWAYCENSSPIH